MATCRYFLIILFFCTSFFSIAQEYAFIHYTPKDGLVNSRLRKSYQDSRGRMFFMTANGLSIYDGARFTNYTIDDGLPNPLVNDVLELGPDSFLVATNTNKLVQLVRGRILPVNVKSGITPVINTFYRGMGNKIYVASDDGFFLFKNNAFINIPIHDPNAPDLSPALAEVIETANNFFLIQYHPHQPNVLFCYNKSTGAVHSFGLGTYINSIVVEEERNLLIIVVPRQFQAFDLKQATLGNFINVPVPEEFLKFQGYGCNAIKRDRTGKYWGTAASFLVKQVDKEHFQLFNRSNGLSTNNIIDFFVDKENILWILTDGSGVIKLPGSDVEWSNAIFGQPSTSISAIFTDSSSNDVWIYNWENNHLYNKTGDELKSWRVDTVTRLFDIKKIGKRLILFDTYCAYEAIFRKDNSTVKLKKIYCAVSGTNMNKSLVTTRETIFFPGYMISAITLDGSLKSYKLPFFADQLAFDREGNLWTATRSGDLLKFKVTSSGKGDFVSFVHNFKTVIPKIDPRSIAIDKNNNVWVGTRYSGLYCFTFNDTLLAAQYHFTMRDGLTDNFVYDLIVNAKNEVWVGTQSGLDKVSFQNGKYVVDGVTRRNNIFLLTSQVMLGKNNELWTLGNGSIVRVLNENKTSTGFIPQLQLARIRSTDSIYESPQPNLSLSYRNNNLSFEVAAPSFVDENQVRFSYQLEGSANTEWSPGSTTANFNFVNLPHGRYVLHVKAFFPVTSYPEQEISYEFFINPPWFKTWWFRVLAAILIVAAVTQIIRMYYSRKLHRHIIAMEKQQLVEQERTRIAMEMHDDLGSGLTAIRYMAGGLTTNTTGNTKFTAEKILTSAKVLVDNMNDIIWTIKSDNNKLSEVLGYIKMQAAEQLQQANLDYNFELGEMPDVVLRNETKRNLLMISKEAVHNIIKHANASNVTVSATSTEKTLKLSITDNGKGINLNGTMGNGLKNMRKRTSMMGGELTIEGSQGTKITLVIPF